MSMMIEGRRETVEQSDTAAIVTCDRLSGVLTDTPGAETWSSPQYLVSHSLKAACVIMVVVQCRYMVVYAIAIRRGAAQRRSVVLI